MRRRVYLETTIISYLTARPSRNVVSAAHQQITVDWWARRRHEFDLLVSELVLREAVAGDPEAARRRLEVVAGLPRLALTEEALRLAGACLTVHLYARRVAWRSVMSEDPIVQEVRRIRQEHAARFDYDLEAIFADLKRSEEARDPTQSPLISPPKARESVPNPAFHRAAVALRRVG
jgi:hypothetical protein